VSPSMPALLAGGVLAASLALSGIAHAEKWPAIDPAELHGLQPTVNPEADAEALLWEIRVFDEAAQSSVHSDVSQYLRIKIFTEHGKELASRIDIPFEGGNRITELAARTIRPDGSTVEVPRKSFLERTIIKAGGRKVKAMSFAFPSAEKGSIVEYRWTYRRYETIAHGLSFVLQRAIPVRSTELWVRPLSYDRIQFRMRSFNMATPHFESTPDGYQRSVLPSIDAARDEPFMPPASAVSPWVFFYYATAVDPPPDRVWRDYVKSVAEETARKLKPDGVVRAKATEIVAGAHTDDEKLARLYDYCRLKIRNSAYDVAGAAAPDSDAKKSNRSPAETLKRAAGSAADVDYLFAAMASALGYQTRIAMTSDRRENLFNPNLGLPGFLDEWCVAVWVGSGWRFFDPAARFVPPGMLPWWEEGQEALLVDASETRFLPLPVSPPESSRVVSTGRFRLSADGTLDGRAAETYAGHWGAWMKESLRELSPDERVRRLRSILEQQYPGSVIDSIGIEHADDPDGLLFGTYHIRVPGYASRAGSRLLPALSFFQRGSEAIFTEASRRYPLHFRYAYTRKDSVLIELPDGFEVESAPEPRPVTASGFASLQPTIRVAADGRSIQYIESASICEERVLSFPVSEYSAIKTTFDLMRERAQSSVSLRRTDRASAP
jgi:hypothetical protein